MRLHRRLEKLERRSGINQAGEEVLVVLFASVAPKPDGSRPDPGEPYMATVLAGPNGGAIQLWRNDGETEEAFTQRIDAERELVHGRRRGK